MGEGRYITNRGRKTKIIAAFWSETMQARRHWDNNIKVLKDKNCQPRFLYSVKTASKNNGKIKTVPDIQRLKEFITNRHLCKKC